MGLVLIAVVPLLLSRHRDPGHGGATDPDVALAPLPLFRKEDAAKFDRTLGALASIVRDQQAQLAALDAIQQAGSAPGDAGAARLAAEKLRNDLAKEVHFDFSKLRGNQQFGDLLGRWDAGDGVPAGDAPRKTTPTLPTHALARHAAGSDLPSVGGSLGESGVHEAATTHVDSSAPSVGVDEPAESGQDAAPAIAHFVNLMPAGNTHHADQEVTLASLIRAKEFSEAHGGPSVKLFAIEYDDDPKVPRDRSLIHDAVGLKRDIYELYGMGKWGIKRRRLPLISDILGSMYDSTNAQTVVYSNADIAMQEEFYVKASKMLRRPSDSVAINRVEIPLQQVSGEITSAHLGQYLRLGKRHPQLHHGFDCFVFPRIAIPYLKLYLRSAFVAYPPIGKRITDALTCVTSFRVVRGEHLTFHLGVKNGGWEENSEYEFYNRKASKQSEQEFPKVVKHVAGAALGNVCDHVKRTLKRPDDPMHAAALEEYARRPFVYPIYAPKPEWEAKGNGAGATQTVEERALASPAEARLPAAVSRPGIVSSTSAVSQPTAESLGCLSTSEFRRNQKVRHLIVASSGRVGSTMLAEVLKREGVQVTHTHLSAARIAEQQRKDGKMTPVLYIFSDPIDVILSLRQRDLDTGDSFFGKNISWVRKHLENMEVPEQYFDAWQRQEYFDRDVLHLQDHFHDWHRSHSFPLMSLRYETERQYMAQLSAFLGLSSTLRLPSPNTKIAGSKGKVPRSERFKLLASKKQSALMATYGALQEQAKHAPDFCVFPTKAQGSR